MKFKRFFDPSLFCIQTELGKVSFLSLFLPILFESATTTVLSTVNTAVISGYSNNAAAAIGACTPIISMLLLLQTVISLGTSVIVSNSVGAKDLPEARRISFTGILISTASALLITPVAFIFAEQIMHFQNLDGEIFDVAVRYFRIRAIFFLCHALSAYMTALLRCYGYARYTFYVGVINNLLNLAFSLLAINLPNATPESAAGIMALGCGISNLVSLVYLAAVFKKRGIALVRPKERGALFGYAKRILNIGVPSAISSMSFTVSQIVTTAFVVMIGDYALSAKVIYTQILSYAYLFSYSAGSANAILIGMRYGAREYDKMTLMNRQLSRITSAVNLLISLSIVLLRVPLLNAFAADGTVIALALGVFLVDILTEQGRAISQVYEYALRAIGDVWAGLVALVISCWVFGIGLAYLCSIPLAFGIIGCWIGLAADECFRGIFMYFRWKTVLKRLDKSN